MVRKGSICGSVVEVRPKVGVCTSMTPRSAKKPRMLPKMLARARKAAKEPVGRQACPSLNRLLPANSCKPSHPSAIAPATGKSV